MSIRSISYIVLDNILILYLLPVYNLVNPERVSLFKSTTIIDFKRPNTLKTY